MAELNADGAGGDVHQLVQEELHLLPFHLPCSSSFHLLHLALQPLNLFPDAVLLDGHRRGKFGI